MLVESLLFLLIDNGVVLKRQIVEAIDSVIDVKQEMAGTSEGVIVGMASIGLLRAVSASLAATAAP